jgi:hypothetical protein
VAVKERNIYTPGSPLAKGSVWAGGPTRPAGYPSGGVPPAVERQLHLHHTPSRVPQRWGTTSCREAAPLTPHAQPGSPAVGVPPAVERRLHLLIRRGVIFARRENRAEASNPNCVCGVAGVGAGVLINGLILHSSFTPCALCCLLEPPRERVSTQISNAPGCGAPVERRRPCRRKSSC